MECKLQCYLKLSYYVLLLNLVWLISTSSVKTFQSIILIVSILVYNDREYIFIYLHPLSLKIFYQITNCKD